MTVTVRASVIRAWLVAVSVIHVLCALLFAFQGGWLGAAFCMVMAFAYRWSVTVEVVRR